MTENNHPRAGDLVAAHVQSALAACAALDRVTWDVGLQLLPTQQGPQPAFAVLLRMPAPVLGQHVAHVLLLGVDDVSEAAVGAGVREAVEVLRRQRSEMLAGGNGAGLIQGGRP